MTVEELIKALKEVEREGGDQEIDHAKADDLLIEFIGDKRVKKAYDAIDKWYA